MSTQSFVKCVLCQANLNLKRGSLDKFKSHLDNFHDAIFDLDLIISLSFLETEEKERIVGTVFPRIKKFFTDVSSSEKEPIALAIEKKLEEEGVMEEITASRKRARTIREHESKYESLMEDVHPIKKKVKVEHQNEARIVIENVESKNPEPNDYESVDSVFCPTGKSPENIENVSDEKFEEEEGSLTEKFFNPGESACDICDKVMRIKSIKRHKQRVHQLFDDNAVNDSLANSDTSVVEETPPVIEPVEEVRDKSKNIPEDLEKSIRKSIRKHKQQRIHQLQHDSTGTADESLAHNDEAPAIVEHLEELREQNIPEELFPVQNRKTKNVNCEVCNKSIFKKNISRHMKTVHPRSEEMDVEEAEESAYKEPVDEVSIEEDTEEKDNANTLTVETEAFVSKLGSLPVNESEIELERDIRSEKEGERESEIEVEKDIQPDIEKEQRESKVECPDCSKKITRSNLRRHVRNIHSGADTNKTDLETADMDEASENDEASDEVVALECEEHKCKICFAMFEDKIELAEHFQVVHDIDIEDIDALDDDEEE